MSKLIMSSVRGRGVFAYLAVGAGALVGVVVRHVDDS